MIPAGTLLDDRWRVGDQAGAGVSGVVYRGVDHDGTAVAIKVFFPDATALAGHRQREIDRLAAMEWPGIVRFVGHGVCEQGPYLVTRWVTGRPFGTVRLEREAVVQVLLRALRALRRLHEELRAVHGDLKPDNLLVDDENRPCILDFGAARELNEGGPVEGNEPWAAPEVLFGDQPTPASDLYALALMGWRALTGVDALPCRTRDELYESRRRRGRPQLPPGQEDDDLLQALAGALAQDPEERTTSASLWEVLSQLAPDVLVDLDVHLQRYAETRDVEHLRACFAGADRFVPLRMRVVDALVRRSGGEPVLLRALLAAWVDDGLLSLQDDGLEVQFEDLSRIEATVEDAPDVAPSDPCELSSGQSQEPSAEVKIRRLFLHPPADFASEVAGLARELGERGRVEAALGWLERAAERARRERLPGRGDLALAALDVALERPMRGTFADAHRIAQRCEDAEVAELAHIAMTANPDAAQGLLRALPDDPNHRLATQVVMLRAAAAFRLRPEQHERELRRLLERYADLPAMCWMRDDWLGKLDYRQGRYAQAADAFLRAYHEAPTACTRVRELLSVAAACLEVADHRRACLAAQQAAEEAVAADFLWGKVRAELRLRSASYRAGEWVAADPELVDELAAAGWWYLAGLAALTEAGFAGRMGEHDLALELLEPLIDGLDGQGPDLCLLGRALTVHLQDDLELRQGVLTELRERAVPRGIEAQALVLMGEKIPDDLGDESLPDWRRELLSPAEIKRMAAGGPSPFFLAAGHRDVSFV